MFRHVAIDDHTPCAMRYNWGSLLLAWLCAAYASADSLKVYNNPILPGFHPDPSCIRVEEWDNTFFCATSSFNVVPGVPIFASKDLQNFRQIGEVFVMCMCMLASPLDHLQVML